MYIILSVAQAHVSKTVEELSIQTLPRDFAVLAVVRPDTLDGGFLFSVVNEPQTVVLFGIEVTHSVKHSFLQRLKITIHSFFYKLFKVYISMLYDCLLELQFGVSCNEQAS